MKDSSEGILDKESLTEEEWLDTFNWLEMEETSIILDALEFLEETLDFLRSCTTNSYSLAEEFFKAKFFCLVFLNSSSLILKRLSLGGLSLLDAPPSGNFLEIAIPSSESTILETFLKANLYFLSLWCQFSSNYLWDSWLVESPKNLV